MTTGAVMLSFHSLFFTALAAVIVVVSVAAFLFPTHYRLSDAGIEPARAKQDVASRRKPQQP